MKYLILVPLLALTGCETMLEGVTQLSRDAANDRAEKQMAQGFYGWGDLAPESINYQEILRQQNEDELTRRLLWELQYGKFNKTFPHH